MIEQAGGACEVCTMQQRLHFQKGESRRATVKKIGKDRYLWSNRTSFFNHFFGGNRST